MTLRVAIQMDPMDAINPKSDTSLLLAREAISRGYKVWHYTPNRLTYREGEITARGSAVTLHDHPERFYELGEEETLDLKSMDVILLRQDPPFDMSYITSTYYLEALMPEVLVANHPSSVRNLPEKWLPTLFPEFMPPTLLTSDAAEVEAFCKEYKDIVIKPFYGHGGRSVFRTGTNDSNFHALLEMMLSKSREPLMVQRFLPEVKSEDRRIILIDGEFAGAVGRIPAQDEIRANFRTGGTAAKVELSKRQKDICEALGPMMQEEGILFAGVDVIGDWLTEVNITSPTGFVPINRLYDKQLEAQFWDAVESYLP